MNDLPPDLDALASAFLDDEASLDERALAAGDPALRAEIEERVTQLGAVRALLADVEPAAISTREAHLAAALAAWDRIPEAERTGSLRDVTPRDVDAAAVAGAASVSAPTRRPERRRQRSARWLTAAAAVVAVVAAGGVVARFALTENDDGGQDAGEATADISMSATEASDGADDAGAATELRTEAADAAAPEPSIVGGTFDTGIDDPAPPPESGLVVLTGAEDLRDFAAVAADAPSSPAGVPDVTSAAVDDDTDDEVAQIPDCGFDVVVGPAIYVDVPVVVGIDRDRDRAIAARLDDCVEIASVRLP